MVVMGIPDARVFPFIDAPPIEKINKSLALLTNIGALDPKEAPTQIGKTLAQLPVDLVIGKILIMGSMFVGLVDSVVMLCGGLSLQSLYNNKAHKDLDMCKRRKVVMILIEIFIIMVAIVVVSIHSNQSLKSS